MAAESICDNCGKREPMIVWDHNWHKPSKWFERSDENGIQTACSRGCIDKISEKTEKNNIISPF